MDIRYIIYVNAKGDVKSYGLEDVSENDTYIQAIHNGKLKTFRKDRILYENADPACLEHEIERLLQSGTIEVQKPKVKPLLEVCFTGFSKDEKETLSKLAESKQCLVRKSVTVDLDVLCYGDNAGPAKIRNARNKGILILEKDAFRMLIETGEIYCG